MALATVTDGIFYNVTNAWDAFDVGDGITKDHLTSTYDINNTFSTETGLTQNKYVKMICTNIGDESTCNTTNLYSGKALEVRIDMNTDIIESVLLENGD